MMHDKLKSGMKVVTRGWVARSKGEATPSTDETAKPSPAPKQQARRKPKPIKVMVYLETEDAVVTLQTIQHLQKMLSKSGYAENQIIEVERGSVWVKMMAWWNEDDVSPSTQAAKDKVGEYASIGEEVAKDVLLNERRSKISRENAETFSLYMEQLKDLDNGAIAADGWLIIKSTDGQGRTSMITQRLSLEHQRIVEKNPNMLRDPARILENLGLEKQMSIEQ